MDVLPQAPESEPEVLQAIGHPRGTLAIVIVFALLFALGWFTAYFAFVSRGLPHH